MMQGSITLVQFLNEREHLLQAKNVHGFSFFEKWHHLDDAGVHHSS
jgi:hypothetical protein